MQFITLDQRIAVENFEVGVVYTVAFTSGDSFTGSCMGIGIDFVAFQRTAPEYIYCLTMAAAADVASIDPLPEEIGQILEYTGSVPVSIKTDGSPLLDYLITGKTVQNGTPTPESPIMPEGCGDLETTGEHAGQYKIPILCGDTTTNIYLGEAERTRLIKKLVLKGDEDWERVTAANPYFRCKIGVLNYALTGEIVCTHYEAADITSSTSYTGVYIGNSALLGASTINIRDTSIFTNITMLRQYLTDQYANGTPVTVWYVLSSATTGIVNEPLMRIGDYADTLNYRQSGVNIPTTDGLNIFDIDTTVKPSEVYLKYFSPLF